MQELQVTHLVIPAFFRGTARAISNCTERIKMNIKDILEILNEVEDRGAFSFVAVTTKDALKKSRKTNTATPENLSTVTVVRACTVSLGNNYQNAVNNRRKTEGKKADFKAQPTYCEPISKNLLVFKHKKIDQYYLRVYPNLARSFKTIVRYFDVNKVEITQNWRELEAEYFTLQSQNKNQGLENQVLVNNYKLENVKYLKRGEILIDELTSEIITLTAA